MDLINREEVENKLNKAYSKFDSEDDFNIAMGIINSMPNLIAKQNFIGLVIDILFDNSINLDFELRRLLLRKAYHAGFIDYDKSNDTFIKNED